MGKMSSFDPEEKGYRILCLHASKMPWGEALQVSQCLHELNSKQDFLLYINTGILVGDFKDFEGDVISYHETNNSLVISFKEHFDGLRIMGSTIDVEIDGHTFPLKHYDTYVCLKTYNRYRCFVNELPEILNRRPRVSDQECVGLLDSIQKFLSPFVEENVNKHNALTTRYTFDIREHDDYSNITSRVEKVFELYLSTYVDSDDFDVLDQASFSFNFIIYQTTYRTFLALPNIYVPEYMRGRGVYTGAIKLISEFLTQHELGREIGFTDSSEDGSTSRVAERYNVFGDPFFTTRYDLLIDSLT